MEFLPLNYELVLCWFYDKKLLPPKPTISDLYNFQEKNYTVISKIEILPILYALLKEGYLKKYNPNFSLDEKPLLPAFEEDDIFYITLKGKKYLENSKVERHKINTAEDANKKADRAILQSKIANTIAFLALIIALCEFFNN